MALTRGTARRRMTSVEEVERRVAAYVDQHSLIAPGGAVLLAVSGGPDSLCLLHLMARLASALRCRPAVAYLDHGLRGAEATADAAFVAAEAARLGLPFHAGRVDVPALAR